MIIRLDKMIPLPLLEQDTSGSELWEREEVHFETGKHYGIEAESGRGKTTLLSIIYGIRKDYQGRVFMDGKNIEDFRTRQWSQLRKNKLSMIFQGLELFDELSALDNIRLKNQMTRHHPEERIYEMASMLGIENFLKRKTGILSFGQQQRVAIVRALCQPFDFLLADECFSHMDQKNTSIAYGLIKQECENRGAGLILTSLNKSELEDMEEQYSL